MTLNTVTGRLESGPTQIVRLQAENARLQTILDRLRAQYTRECEEMGFSAKEAKSALTEVEETPIEEETPIYD